MTKVTEYSKAKVMNAKISVTTIMTKALTRTSISSALSRGCWWLLDNHLSRISFNFLLQDRGYKIFWASLIKLTAGLLALLSAEVVWILAKIAILVVVAPR